MNVKTSTIKCSTPVAIIGIECFFPKSSGLKEYWRLLFHAEDAIIEVPKTHWLAEDYFDKDPSKSDHVYCKRGGFLSPVLFDPTEFGIPPSSLEATDTSQLLGLVTAKQALENSGYGDNQKTINRERISVILGVTGTQELVIPLGARLGHPIWRKALQDAGVSPELTEDVIERISDSYVTWQENSFPGLLGNVVAGRICNRLNFGGTNCVVDAACASSMSAIHLAILELQSGRADMVVTGGVDTLNDIFMHSCFAKTMILSPTGDARPFSKDADGTVLGEGIGMLILKRLEDAEKDGDRIYAVIKGLGSSSDGKSQSIYSPRAEGQAKALSMAYEIAGVEPASVELIEAHGTGTRVGDAVEFRTLRKVFQPHDVSVPGHDSSLMTHHSNRCAIGSVKSNIGHTKAAAGAAGLIKAILSLYHKVFTPTLKIDAPDPGLNIQDSPFYLCTQSRPWFSRKEHPRRAGVSAFGFGGSNFHIVLEEHKSNKQEISWDGSVDIIALSGSNRDELEASLFEWKSAVDRGMPDKDFFIKAFNSRNTFSSKAPYRLLMVIDRSEDSAKNPAELFSAALTLLKSNENQKIKNVFYSGPSSFIVHRSSLKIAFVFPGQGSQYIGMGRDLVCTFPDAFHLMEKANELSQNLLREQLNNYESLTDVIYPYPALTKEEKDIQEARLRRTDIAQPAIGAVSMGMLKILEGFGIKPDAVCGHSFGELSALCASNRIDMETFFHLAAIRGNLMASAGQKTGGMLAVHTPLDKIQHLIQEAGLNLILANRNSPEQGVLSGTIEEIAKAEALCGQKGIKTKRLPVSAAFHSPLLKDVYLPFVDALKSIEIHPSDIPVFSNTTGEPYPMDSEEAKRLLGSHLLHPVDFISEINNLHNAGIHFFIEVGPKPILTDLIKSILKGKKISAIPLDVSCGKRFGLAELAAVLCHLASAGYPVELNRWESTMPEIKKQRMSIPISGVNYRSEKTENKRRKSEREKQKAEGRRQKADLTPHKINQPVAENKTAINITENKSTMNITDQKPNANYHQNLPLTSIHGQSDFISNALNAVQEGLKSMQALQMQTADVHKKFLETQTEAGRTLQQMMDHTRRLAEISMGIKPLESDAHNLQFPIISAAAPNRSPERTQIVEPIPGSTSPKHEYPPQKQAFIQKNEAVSQSSQIPIAAKPETSALEIKKVQSTLLEVVSQLTGYPTEMLSLDMDIEADLGIDSIKRVEILSNLEEKMPGLPQVSPEIMGSLKTLGQVVEYLIKDMSLGTSDPPMHKVQAIQKSFTDTHTEPASQIQTTLLTVVSELTGYPTEMLTLDMDIEADLGIDSIKRVEILSNLEEKMPGLPQVSPEIMGNLKTLGQIVEYLSNGGSSAASGFDRSCNAVGVCKTNSSSLVGGGNDIQATLLSVVSDLTGYPIEMLSSDMDIEADLGIDSIKRVEILSNLEEKMPGLPPVSPEIMGTLKTLGQIVDYLSGGTKDNIPQPDISKMVQKKIISIMNQPFEPHPSVTIPQGRIVYVTDDKIGLSKAIADELKERNIDAVLIDAQCSNFPSAGGLVFVAGTDQAVGWDDTFLKQAFVLARQAAPELISKDKGSIFASITRMDGAFGFKGKGVSNPMQGGLAGLVKTASIEWEGVCCHAIDITPAWNDYTNIAKTVVDELLHIGPIEIGLEPGFRYILNLESSLYPQGKINLSSGDVVVITGGGRGVTAAAAYALAKQVHPTIVLLGRSPHPSPEPQWLKSITDDASMKKVIFENEFGAKPASPMELEQSFRKHKANREILDNLNRLRSTGSRVHYYPADVRDSDVVRSILEQVRAAFGPIKGIIHGAGTLEDRLIVDKTPEQFEKVFDTKVKGLKVLLEATHLDPLKYIVLFSSVSARMGNKGQVDYAMANEVLNKIAQQESIARPDCRVISINWGPWDGGMVSDALKREFLRTGIELIPIDAGARAMVDEMRGDKQSPVEVVIGASIIPETPKTFDIKTPSISSLPSSPNKNERLSLIFKRELSIEQVPILGSHILDGKPVVPFALMAEWMSQGALHENPGLFLHGLDDIRLFNGIKIAQENIRIQLLAGKPRKMPIASGMGLSYEVDVEIRNGRKKEDKELIHTRATAILTDVLSQPPVFKNIGDLNAKTYPRSMDEVYDKILFHGFDLHGIKEIIYCSPDGMAAQISSAPQPSKWMTDPLRTRWAADPLVLDCAFQMAIVWCYEQKEVVSLPSYSASYRQYRNRFPADGVMAVLEVRDVTDKKLKGDFTFLDSEHQVVAQLIGYEAVMDASLFKAFNRRFMRD